MIKYFMLIIAPLMASNYALAHDVTFYSLHPVELQKALEQCPKTHPNEVSCEQLDACATRANRLVSELHYNPQVFGQKILALQEETAKIEAALKDNPGDGQLVSSVDENKKQLRERLAIVKWLESPRG